MRHVNGYCSFADTEAAGYLSIGSTVLQLGEYLYLTLCKTCGDCFQCLWRFGGPLFVGGRGNSEPCSASHRLDRGYQGGGAEIPRQQPRVDERSARRRTAARREMTVGQVEPP